MQGQAPGGHGRWVATSMRLRAQRKPPQQPRRPLAGRRGSPAAPVTHASYATLPSLRISTTVSTLCSDGGTDRHLHRRVAHRRTSAPPAGPRNGQARPPSWTACWAQRATRLARTASWTATRWSASVGSPSWPRQAAGKLRQPAAQTQRHPPSSLLTAPSGSKSSVRQAAAMTQRACAAAGLQVTSFAWGGHHLNAVDTPGHADFGGEVERCED